MNDRVYEAVMIVERDSVRWTPSVGQPEGAVKL
jgi:hypothetical protein